MIKEAISKVIKNESLDENEAAEVMREIMEGTATPAQFGAFVTALRCKGETDSEITGMAKTIRAKAVSVSLDLPLIDTCGTGGDGSSTFNISTGAAIVAAAAGLNVAKHGNRAMSSSCGSADVLEALGVRVDLNAEGVENYIKDTGFGFIFAPLFHSAMKAASGFRREIGIRTVFNILGPLTNPAGAKAQVLGVPDAALVDRLAIVLKRLGAERVLVVHGEDGLDEITITGKTKVCELKNGKLLSYEIAPEDFGVEKAEPESIKSSSLQQSVEILKSVVSGDKGAHRDAIITNAAAVLMVGGKAETLKEGAEMARDIIDSRAALEKLRQLVEYGKTIS